LSSPLQFVAQLQVVYSSNGRDRRQSAPNIICFPIRTMPLPAPMDSGDTLRLGWTLDFQCALGLQAVTDLLIQRRAIRVHSSPRWKVAAVSPQCKATHSQSLHDDNDDNDDAWSQQAWTRSCADCQPSASCTTQGKEEFVRQRGRQ
jgi:hypothetical protein